MLDTYNDHNFNRNSHTGIYAEEAQPEELSGLELLQLEVGEYQQKYMAEKAKNKQIENFLRDVLQVNPENSGNAIILLNKFFGGTGL